MVGHAISKIDATRMANHSFSLSLTPAHSECTRNCAGEDKEKTKTLAIMLDLSQKELKRIRNLRSSIWPGLCVFEFMAGERSSQSEDCPAILKDSALAH